MNFLIDECLHTSLVAVADQHGHQASHVNWLGLSGETDWGLMRRIVDGDFTFVTNNAKDFRRLYAKEAIHPGLLIIVPQVVPEMQRQLFEALVTQFGLDAQLINEVIEVEIVEGGVIINRYDLSG